eukprot:7991891-Pyramimonas_sp.AAC.1
MLQRRSSPCWRSCAAQHGRLGLDQEGASGQPDAAASDLAHEDGVRQERSEDAGTLLDGHHDVEEALPRVVPVPARKQDRSSDSGSAAVRAPSCRRLSPR